MPYPPLETTLNVVLPDVVASGLICSNSNLTYTVEVAPLAMVTVFILSSGFLENKSWWNESLSKEWTTRIAEVMEPLIKDWKAQAEILLEDSNKKNNDNEVAQNVELFNDKELNRALSYVKKRWAPDNTINMAAWNHAKQIKITQTSENNSTSKEPENKTQLALISK